MDEIQIFKNEQFGNIRAFIISNKPWFVGKDICQAFGDKNHSRSLARIATTDKTEKEIIDILGRKQKAICVNESGLYSLLFNMQPQKANNDEMQDAYPIEVRERIKKLEQFKHWVTSKVLPSIRKNGGYIVGQETLSDDELLAKALLIAQNKIDERDKTIAHQQTEINRMKPKEIFADAVRTSKNTILIGDLAKLLKQNGIEIEQNRLFEWLRVHCYLIRRKGKSFNLPTQRSMNLGLFKIKESVITDKAGKNFTYSTTTVTPKGQQYFIDKFLNLKEQES